MQTELLPLRPEDNAIDAIAVLLAHRISGAPVVGASGVFLGSFSEKTAMSVLLGAAYDRLPDPTVGAFMDADPGRIIRDRNMNLLSICDIFLTTPYRRLLVLDGGRVVGLIVVATCFWRGCASNTRRRTTYEERRVAALPQRAD